MAIAAVSGLFGSSLVFGAANAAVAPVGNGFTVTASDLNFILTQIKIAERHTRAFEGDPAVAPQPNPNPALDPSYCLSMIGSAADQIPDALTTYGLRTVDGQCNNLANVLEATTQINNTPKPTAVNHPTFGAADQPFPRLTTPVFRQAEAAPPSFGGGAVTSYAQKLAGNVVFDSEPRLISNLIVDQTSTNPAAIAAAGFPVRAQNGGSPTVPCLTDPLIGLDLDPLTPLGCVPQHKTLFIENVTTDVGLSPPYNSLFTFFGQFFDHGVDQTVKSGGTVIVPLRDDDPLVAGPDHIFGNANDLPVQLRFIALTRAQNQPGPDGTLGTADDVNDTNNTDTPWVDQSQTYTSHSSHQFFLREYISDGAGHPLATGRFLGGLAAGQTYTGSPDGRTGMSTWAATKLQAATQLGLLLADKDVFNVPMILADPYGNYIPGPARGLPQYVTASGLVEGNLSAPVAVPANIVSFDTPFLTDIAHNAAPKAGLSPDADDTPSVDFAAQPAGTYDNEMLDAHFTCGDGRCNENIALSTIHQIFHSEHDRLADEFDTITLPANPSLQTDYMATNCAIGCLTNDPLLPTTYTYGQRLFQAARFVTEMEYQHLVFEEFARKIQPAVRLFHVYSPDINPAIKAEFAHAVYRFGHSMLDDDVARTSTKASGAKVDNSLPLLTAFLNPPEYFDNSVDPAHPVYTAEQAAGAVVMGSADQAGNELDEFINETLRNNLLGLPLDLATLNLTRARDAGIPPLNQVRRQIFAQTNDGQLAPYTSWSDFGQHIKHPESLINFVAAYGTHPTVTGVSTIEGKRLAARAIVNPILTDVPPADAAEFMFSTGAWADDANGVTTTGLDSVDMWIGGLAEVTNLFGGLLGSTNNYVFQTQLENLQDGDRLYYLARTPGLNLRTQLEGNSFSELIQRNTDGTNTLKADAFATADCKFQLANLNGTPAGFATSGASVADDPTTTDCTENLLLQRKPDGTIQYKAINTVDPTGINGQSVYNGTPLADRIFGGNDNDTFWGGVGNDIIEGGGGDDVALGGDGNDIITDLGGADVLKGGPGNDAIDAGIGDDIMMGADGNDFLNGGSGDNEEFAGPGNDFIIAGQGADAVFGDGGDDWIQGGTGQDLLQGDHGAPFFDDPGQVAPGNDIMIGQPGENDYDAEGGDDLMAQNAAIDRNAGAAGFDWAFHQYNTIPADDDMNINKMLLGVPIQLVVNRDRWQETEANSGANLNDVIRGSSDLAIPGGAGFSGCDALDPAGVARIGGLDRYVTAANATTVLQAVIDATRKKFCPLTGFGAAPLVPGSGFVWAQGNILLGGGGSDLIEGRGNNDVIDGDHMLRVRISVHANPDGTGVELGSTDLMEGVARTGDFGPGTTGMTLQQAVFAGKVDPGQLVGTRDIVGPGAFFPGTPIGLTANTATPGDCGPIDLVTHVVNLATTKNCDTSLYSAAPDQYTITANADGSTTVAFNNAIVPFGKDDGIDTLWNVENLRFCTGTDAVTKLCNAFQDVQLRPAASVSPTTLTFGAQAINTSSAPQSVVVTNVGSSDLLVLSADLGGTALITTDPTSFSVVNGCAAAIPSGASCTISVGFSPTTEGDKSATLSITTNDAVNPVRTVSLGGTGVAPLVTVMPGSLTFATRTVNTTSAAQSLLVTNTGSGDLVVESVTITGVNATNFAITNNTCVAPLAPAVTCTVDVTFTPNATGVRLASVVIATNAVVAPTVFVALSGTGQAVTATTTATIANARFGRVLRGTSVTKTVLVTNTGANPLVITAAFVGAAFTVNLGTCATPVRVGRTCKLNVTFSPVAVGTVVRTLKIQSNAGNAPVAAMTGTGR